VWIAARQVLMFGMQDFTVMLNPREALP
jgi:hypothetical protein